MLYRGGACHFSLMFPDDVVGFVIQGVHIIEVDSPVVEASAVFVVTDQAWRRVCDFAVHLDSKNLPPLENSVFISRCSAQYSAYGIPEMCRFLGFPLVFAKSCMQLWVDNSEFIVCQRDQVWGYFFFDV